MPLFRLCLVVIRSLGMQVPGGLQFELCACRGLSELLHGHRRGAVDQGCCADSGAADSCDGEPVVERSRSGECCGCFDVTTPSHPSVDLPPFGVTVAHRAHDPPWARMNAPLRI